MSDWPIPRISGSRVLIRPIEESDRDQRAAMPRYPELTRLYGGQPDSDEPRLLTEDELSAWYDGHTPTATEMKWVIDLDGQLIGGIRFHRIDTESGVASIALGIYEPENWGRGYGTEAINLALSHGFGELDFHRIELIVLETNERAIKAYEKCGFVTEGRMRERALIDGERVSDLMMSLLASDFQEGAPG